MRFVVSQVPECEEPVASGKECIKDVAFGNSQISMPSLAQWLGPTVIWRKDTKVIQIHPFFAFSQYLALLSPHQVAIFCRASTVI